MQPCYVALTALTDQIRMDDLARVAAALQIQVTRDFAPIWGAPATIVGVPFEAIPSGFCPIIVHDTLDAAGANGWHRTRSDDSPYCVIPYGPNWPLAASHELLRMLANPTGSARRAGQSCLSGQAQVDYMLDICAPCQDVSSAYAIDGIIVSDFCTEAFFSDRPSGSLSFNYSVVEAFRPAPGGVVTWLADDGLAYQIRATERGTVCVHGGFSVANRSRFSMQELINLFTPDTLRVLAASSTPASLRDQQQNASRVRLNNLLRYKDDIALRFGSATWAETADEMDAASANQASASKTGRSPQREASDELQITARTAL